MSKSKVQSKVVIVFKDDGFTITPTPLEDAPPSSNIDVLVIDLNRQICQCIPHVFFINRFIKSLQPLRLVFQRGNFVELPMGYSFETSPRTRILTFVHCLRPLYPLKHFLSGNSKVQWVGLTDSNSRLDAKLAQLKDLTEIVRRGTTHLESLWIDDAIRVKELQNGYDTSSIEPIATVLKSNIFRPTICRTTVYEVLCCWRFGQYAESSSIPNLGHLPAEIMLEILSYVLSSRTERIWNRSFDPNVSDEVSMAREYDALKNAKRPHHEYFKGTLTAMKSMPLKYNLPRNLRTSGLLGTRISIETLDLDISISKGCRYGHIDSNPLKPIMKACTYANVQTLILRNMCFTKKFLFDYYYEFDLHFIHGNDEGIHSGPRDPYSKKCSLLKVRFIECEQISNFIESLQGILTIQYPGNWTTSDSYWLTSMEYVIDREAKTLEGRYIQVEIGE